MMHDEQHEADPGRKEMLTNSREKSSGQELERMMCFRRSERMADGAETEEVACCRDNLGTYPIPFSGVRRVSVTCSQLNFP